MIATDERKMKVLVIDDEIGPRESMRILLKNEFEVLCADSVDRGLALLADESPDVVVMDIRMPGKSGIEGLKELRQLDPQVSVVMLTGFGALDSAQEAMRHGANDYIEKPFDAGTMRRLIRRYADRTQMERKRLRLADELENLNDELNRKLDEKEHLASLGQASAEFAHDLRNSLTVAYGYVDLLMHQMGGLKRDGNDMVRESAEYMERIDRNMRRCAELVDSWQRLIRQGKDSLKPVRVDEVLRDVVDHGMTLAAPRGTRLVYEQGAEDIWVMADRLQLVRCFQNVVNNAIQAVPEAGGVVYLSCRNAEDRCEIVVEDNGPGISSEVRDRLFTAYASTRSGRGGMGLGLFITKKIVTAHGGTIAVDCPADGGTAVTVCLPLCPAAAPAGAEAAAR